MALRWRWNRGGRARRRKPADGPAAAPLLVLQLALIATAACASRAARTGAAAGAVPPAVPPAVPGESSAARYRGSWESGGRSGSFRLHAFAAPGDRLRIDLYPPVGGVRLTVVCADGRGMALIPAERSYWEGPCDAPSDGGEGGFGLPHGARFWRDLLLGRAGSPPPDPDSTIRVEPAGAGEPPLRVEADIAREGRTASLVLVRQALLDPAGEEAFRPSVPEGFTPAGGFDLFDLILPE